MANPTGGFGLRAVRRLDGAALSAQLDEVEIAFNYSGVIAQGDLVEQLSTGFIAQWVNGHSTAIAAGVFMGCKYRDPNQGRTVYAPMWNAVSGLASTDKVKALIMRLPNLVFEIRADGATLPVTVADVGANADIVVGVPSALTGQSVALFSQSSINPATATLPLRVVGLGQGVENDNTLKNNIIEVTINGGLDRSTTGV